MKDIIQEEDMTDQQCKAAWNILYHCVHWGDERARPIMMDQRQLIMLIHYLTNNNTMQSDAEKARSRMAEQMKFRPIPLED